MNEYRVESTGTRLFTLSRQGTVLGKLTYESWFSFRATIELANGALYAVDAKDIWGTAFEVKQGEQVRVEFKMNWKGQIIINQKLDSGERHLLFRQRSIWKSACVLLDDEEKEILVVEPDFTWSKLNYNYQVATTNEFDPSGDQSGQNELLMLTAIHCTNYYIAMMTTSALG